MADRSASKAKLLFVLSSDFGALSNAMYLIMGQDFESVVLMPDRLYAVNKDQLPVQTALYATVQDVLAAVDREKPDIVFLFSAYLYAVNQIFDLDSLGKLIQELRNRGCRVVTSDPFLGLMARVSAATFNENNPARQMMAQHFAQVFGILKDVKHLYLTQPEGLTATESVSFFNPNLVLPTVAVDPRRQKVLEAIGVDPSRKHWLFVLSNEDYWGQLDSHGGGMQFDDLLTDKLRETAREGKQPILVAPPMCASAVTIRTPPVPGILFLTACGYDQFLALLFDAEYVFYCNIFSNSILARVMNHLPFFFFDRGHLVYAIKPLFDEGIKRYYVNSELPYLDIRQPLETIELSLRAASQQRLLADVADNFRRSPSPTEMVERILQS